MEIIRHCWAYKLNTSQINIEENSQNQTSLPVSYFIFLSGDYTTQ